VALLWFLDPEHFDQRFCDQVRQKPHRAAIKSEHEKPRTIENDDAGFWLAKPCAD
jgi:hypothetical protein